SGCSSSYFVFFFSSRRRHTRFDCDWSSDVCSSDLLRPYNLQHPSASRRAMVSEEPTSEPPFNSVIHWPLVQKLSGSRDVRRGTRSEERRVGKEGRARCGSVHGVEYVYCIVRPYVCI